MRLLFTIVFTIIISMTLCVITSLRGNCTCELYVHVFICIYIYACTYDAYIQSCLITYMYVYMTYVCTSYYIERYVVSFNKWDKYLHIAIVIGEHLKPWDFWGHFFLGIPVWQTQFHSSIDWIGLREILQKNIDFPIKYGVFL